MLKDTPLHTDYDTFSEFKNPDGSNPVGYEEARNNYLAVKENRFLFQGNTNVDGQNITVIHDDSKGFPTIGYGFNLSIVKDPSLTLQQQYDVLLEAFQAAYNGTLSQSQLNGMAVIDGWLHGTISNANLIAMAQGDAGVGTPEQREALQSLSVTHDSALKLLDAMLDGNITVGSFILGNYESGLVAALGSGNVAESTEHIALLSAYYNLPGLIGPGMVGAINHDDPTSRAEA